MNWKIRVSITLLLCGLVTLGCNRATEEVSEVQSAEVTAPKKDAFPFNLEAATLLASADKVDGTEDKVIHQCAGCALAMAGSSDNALQVGEYEMHFCSTYCKGVFEKDTETAVMALVIPTTEN